MIWAPIVALMGLVVAFFLIVLEADAHSRRCSKSPDYKPPDYY